MDKGTCENEKEAASSVAQADENMDSFVPDQISWLGERLGVLSSFSIERESVQLSLLLVRSRIGLMV
jgi:hypothetical protein